MLLLSLNLSEGDDSLQVIFLVYKFQLSNNLRPHGAQEYATECILTECAFNLLPVWELQHPISLIGQGHTVKACLCFIMVVTIVTITVLGSDHQNITDGRVVTYLLCVNLSAIGIRSLEGFA